MNYFRNLEYLCSRHKMDMSSLANEIGVDFSDMRKPSPADLVRISSHFGITLDLLLKGNLLKADEIRSRDIKLLVMDVDGVLTDGGMYYSESGDEYKRFNSKDGIALKKIRANGIRTGIISNGTNKNLITKRASLLDIDLVEVSHNNKLDILQAWCAQLGLELQNIAYIGDDVNDEEVLRSVGLAACPADAVERVKLCCHVVLMRNGGEGCVRELIDNYIFTGKK
jgi:3-deoxy-D-manno-octulosonate 8-phosphate phosphatase (KDO 8-P phosphatase)